jgi:hypothetical protein
MKSIPRMNGPVGRDHFFKVIAASDKDGTESRVARNDAGLQKIS